MGEERLWSIGQHVFPICDAKVLGHEAQIGRFLGTGFWLTNDGFFATCKHVIEAVSEDHEPLIARPFSAEQDSYTRIRGFICHNQFDIAIGKVRRETAPLAPYTGKIGMGLRVQAFGFSDDGKRGGSYRVDTRLLMGHVSCTNDDPGELPSSSLLEISFAATSGYSGAPLLVDDKVIGMIYGNKESTLNEYRREEIEADGTRYVEVRHRFLEYGLAHPLSAIQEFLNDARQNMAHL